MNDSVKTLDQVRTTAYANREPDQRVDMFSSNGFVMACRIAKAFSSSDAVPTAFRSHVLKKSNGQEQWIENPSALGNCLVAIETAQAVGMSITAVMQNADVIEGKLRWSAKFVIAAINASKRFTPLRFDIKNLGLMKASYKEKGAWDKAANRYQMTEKTVEVENLQCIAWALPAGMPLPQGVYTLDAARKAGLPIIESAPVSMKMAVEEGWYAKSGSKWQTELKHLMLQYRAGTFFGNIHAPDIVMGMGRTAEEEVDIYDAHRQPDESFAVPLDTLRPTPTPEPEAEPEPEPEPTQPKRRARHTATDTTTGEIMPDESDTPPNDDTTPPDGDLLGDPPAETATRRARPPLAAE